jgi:uncharacterized DUF497 family protein
MSDHGLSFEWDEANKRHLAKHDVRPEEAEQAITGDPLDIELQTAGETSDEERLLQIGQTEKGRILQIVTTWRGGKVRVISAWDAPRQLRLYYLAEMRRRHGNFEDSEI